MPGVFDMHARHAATPVCKNMQPIIRSSLHDLETATSKLASYQAHNLPGFAQGTLARIPTGSTHVVQLSHAHQPLVCTMHFNNTISLSPLAVRASD